MKHTIRVTREQIISAYDNLPSSKPYPYPFYLTLTGEAVEEESIENRTNALSEKVESLPSKQKPEKVTLIGHAWGAHELRDKINEIAEKLNHLIENNEL